MRRGAHRTRRGPAGVAVLVLVWALVLAALVAGAGLAVRAVLQPVLGVLDGVL